MKILLPIDGSEYSKRMISYVVKQTSLFGKRHDYTLFTVVPVTALRAIDHQRYTDLEEYCRGEATKNLEPLRALVDSALGKITEVHVYGHPVEEISNFAQSEKVELIIMGSHGHSAVKSLLLGSVVRGVMDRCNVPVLLVR
jgi:nucleotide-binding universal stress UspA family protein